MLHRVLSPLHATIQEQEDSSTPAAPGNLLIPTQEHLFLEMLKPKSCSITSTARLDGRLSLFCQPNPGGYGRRYIRFFWRSCLSHLFPHIAPLLQSYHHHNEHLSLYHVGPSSTFLISTGTHSMVSKGIFFVQVGLVGSEASCWVGCCVTPWGGLSLGFAVM